MKHRNRESMDRIVDFVNDWYREHRTTPSGREIAAGTGIPLTTVPRM